MVSAATSGKVILVRKSNNNLYSRISYGSNEYVFGCIYYNSVFEVIKCDSRGWETLVSYRNETKDNKTDDISTNKTSAVKYPSTKGVADYIDTKLSNYEQTSNKVTSISVSSTDAQYPSAKCVYEALQGVGGGSTKRGIVSQTQKWLQESDGGYDYTMSSIVYGDIPIANIDLFENAGAVFNEISGYFELHGLTDISYKEMILIYEFGDVLKVEHQRGSFSVQNVPGVTFPSLRTFLAEAHYGTSQWANAVNFGISLANSNIEVISPYEYYYKPRMMAWNISVYELDTSTNSQAKYLKKFINVNMDTQSGAKSLFAPSLEDFEVYKIKFGWNLSQSSRLKASSVAICINNAANTSAITITLHGTAYARAIADSDVQAALEAHPTITLASA